MGFFADLLAQDQIGHVVLGIENAVAQSFLQDRARPTGDEIRRRFGLCARLVKQLRGDLGWAIPRVIDHLPGYLRCELDGTPWTPETRTVWIPSETNDNSEEKKR
jgi:hypothetical protein